MLKLGEPGALGFLIGRHSGLSRKTKFLIRQWTEQAAIDFIAGPHNAANLSRFVSSSIVGTVIKESIRERTIACEDTSNCAQCQRDSLFEFHHRKSTQSW